MLNFRVLFIVLLLGLMWSVEGLSAFQCRGVFTKTTGRADRLAANETLSSKILSLITRQMRTGSVTSLRKESKIVVHKNDVPVMLTKLQEVFGAERFLLRDAKTQGYKNITVTQYGLPALFSDGSGGVFAAKARFRKYFIAEEDAALIPENMDPVAFLRDKQFVELKIDHPEYTGVVVKPRLLMKDSDVKHLTNLAKFKRNKSRIIGRVMELNKNTDRELIENFFEVVAEIQFGSRSADIPMFAETRYVRDSYSLFLNNQAGTRVEIQFTIDQEISVLDLNTGERIEAYDPSRAVIEFKIPLAYAELSAENIADVAGLETVKRIIDETTAKRDLRYTQDKGKLSTFRGVRAGSLLLEMVD